MDIGRAVEHIHLSSVEFIVDLIFMSIKANQVEYPGFLVILYKPFLWGLSPSLCLAFQSSFLTIEHILAKVASDVSNLVPRLSH